MGHVYEVHTSDGGAHEVETSHHHADHDHKAFSDHLLDVLKSGLGGFVGHSIVRFIYRGRR